MKNVKKLIKVEVLGDLVSNVNLKSLQCLKNIHWNNSDEIVQNVLDIVESEQGIEINWNGNKKLYNR
jgi:hypothetical protein